MQFSAVFVTLVLAATSTFAAPTPETHFLNKRDAVCGQDFRSLVNNDSCLPNSKVFVLGPTGAPAVVQLTHPPLPAGSQCDHTVELQLLDKVAKQSGLCDVLTTLQTADPTKTKATMLRHAADHISAIANLNFLDSKINNQKKTVVQRALTGAKQGATDIDKAVGNYLRLVSGSAAGVASQIDADIAAIIAAADAVSATMPKQDPKARPSRDPKIAQGEALAKALANYKAHKTTVAATFANVLAVAPHS